jgi:hypothetical protein
VLTCQSKRTSPTRRRSRTFQTFGAERISSPTAAARELHVTKGLHAAAVRSSVWIPLLSPGRMIRMSQVKRTQRRSVVLRGSFSRRRCAGNHEAGSTQLIPLGDSRRYLCVSTAAATHFTAASICTPEPCSPTCSTTAGRGVPGCASGRAIAEAVDAWEHPTPSSRLVPPRYCYRREELRTKNHPGAEARRLSGRLLSVAEGNVHDTGDATRRSP